MLPYLQGCAARGHAISILSCEKPDLFAKHRATVQKLCDQSGIDWQPLSYHKHPLVLSAVYDAYAMSRAALRLHRDRSFDIVHCRSYMPGSAALRLKRRRGVRLIFDMRGFWPEERTEGRSWRLENPVFKLVYGYFKRLEARLLNEADHIVTLTHAAKQIVEERPEFKGRRPRISVIPCSVDFDHFPLAAKLREKARAELGIQSASLVLLYLGSLGGNYMLDEMLDFFRAMLVEKADCRFLFVTMNNGDAIRSTARDRGIDPDRLVIVSATREEVPMRMAAADWGIAFKQPSYSAAGCSPTKLGEMLTMGIPVVANAGVGDVEAMLNDMATGVAIHQFSEESYSAAIEDLKAVTISPKEIRSRARAVLDLGQASERYSEIYRALRVPREAR